MSAYAARRLTLSAYALLVLVIAAWELLFAPAHSVPPIFWFTVKELPLAAALPGLLRGSAHTFEWSGMLIVAYLVNGVMNVIMSRYQPWGLHSTLPYATLETVLALLFFAGALSYLRASKRRPRPS